MVAGVAVPVAISRLLLLADNQSAYWPGGTLVAGVVILAALRGRWACSIGAVVAVFCAWWWFVAPAHSLRIPDWPAALSLGAMVVSISCVTLLVLRLDRSRAAAAVELERSDRIARCAAQLAASATAADVGQAIAAVLAATFRAQVALAVLTEDGAHLELVHLEGFDADVQSRWAGRGWQLDERHPMCDALRGEGWLEFPDAASFDATYPELAGRRTTSGAQSVVAIPLRGAVSRSDPLGVLQLVWAQPFAPSANMREHIELVASMAQLALARLELVARVSRDEFRSALDSMAGEVTIGRAVRDERRRIVDFVIEFITATSVEGTSRTVGDVVGRRMLELVPHWSRNGFFDAIARVVETGVPFVHSRLPLQVATAGGGRATRHWSVQVTRFRDGYLLAWRDVTEELEVERVAQGAREAALREQAAVGVLQEASLPKVMPSDERVELLARYEPVSVDMPVGGDWYDVFWLDDGRLGLVIADVAGHGRAAASEMVQLRNKLRGACFGGDPPERVMHGLNRMAIRTGALATCQFGVLDLDSLQLQWVSAGHLPMVHMPSGGAPALLGPTGDLLLGLDRDATFHAQRVQLAVGDTLLLYTDGLVERRRELLDVGIARLVAVASTGADLATIAADAIRQAPPEPREDDLCLLAVRISCGGMHR